MTPYGVLEDIPTFALYRIYEYILADDTIGMRNELEYFWWKPWRVCEIPDPEDDSAERYAVLSCIPALLVEAFNERLDLGLRREGHAIMSYDERLALAKSVSKTLEISPGWTNRVPALESTLEIPRASESGRLPSSFNDHEACQIFRAKNILIHQLHIHFV